MKFPTKYDHYGYKWLEPIPQGFHPGIDYNYGKPYEDEGQEVIAITNGEVKYAKSNRGWGWHIIIWHPNYKVFSHYAHLQSICVKENDNVVEGQLIGFLGGTGGNWPPHLHFEIRLQEMDPNVYVKKDTTVEEIKSKYANPEKWIKEKMYQEEGKLQVVSDVIQIENKRIVERLKGMILLQVEAHGEAWYVNPIDGKRYYLGGPEDAFRIMKELGLGITKNDLEKIPEGEI